MANYVRAAATAGKLAIDDPYAATMQLAALASGGGGRFLIKKPRFDAKSRAHWVAAIAKFVIDAWRPR